MYPPADRAAVEESGTVKWYNAMKGFGFIASDRGGKDIFVHASALDRAGITGLTEGQRVAVDVIDGRKGPEAAGYRWCERPESNRHGWKWKAIGTVPLPPSFRKPERCGSPFLFDRVKKLAKLAHRRDRSDLASVAERSASRSPNSYQPSPPSTLRTAPAPALQLVPPGATLPVRGPRGP
jgi:cold shock CspA family protein